MNDGALRPATKSSVSRRGLPTSTHAMLALLTMCLVAAFVWWRLVAERDRVESYWARPLAGSAQLYQVRAEEWLVSRRRATDILGALAARGRGPGSAFELALGAMFADGDVPFISLRDGQTLLRCTGVPLSSHCEKGSNEFNIPSPRHPQAHRLRPMPDGHALVPVAAMIPAHDDSDGGVITVWTDPELALFPRLLRTRGSIPGAMTVFIQRSGDSATILSNGPGGTVEPRRRVALVNLPGLIAAPALDSALVVGTGLGGEKMFAAHIYIPRLRWQVYRTLPAVAGYAPFRRQQTTESVLAFILGSFVIGVLVWTVRGQREQRVRAELLQARVESLQAQLRPHFLFNALNTIATLVHEDADAADVMLVRLADLLRLSLEHSDDAEISLRDEIEIFDAYIAVERVRFGAALHVTKAVDPAALDAPVPRWILQPLAENAIKHGAAYTRGAASIALVVRRDGDFVEITLGNDGPHPIGEGAREGIGLRNTRGRLLTLYGTAATLTLRPCTEGGTEAILRIPTPAAMPFVNTGEHAIGDVRPRRVLTPHTPA